MHEIIGTYKFYLDGELIGEQKNALTSAGRSIIIKSLLGYITNFANSISYGIDGTENTFNSASTLITNNSLGFEVGRTPVIAGSYQLSGTNDALSFTGEIMDSYQYTIYEIGLFPPTDLSNSITIDSATILNFDLIDTFSKYGSASTASLQTTSSARIGTQMLVLGSGDGTSNYIETVTDSNSLSYISQFVSQDLFKLSLINTSSTSSAASVYFRFYTDDSNYYTLPFVTPTSSGYSIVSTQKGDAAINGSPTWSDIRKIRIWNASSQDVKLDAIKIDIGSYLVDTNFGMISRAKLTNPIFKPASIPMTIEYSLVVNFDGGV